MTVGHPLETGTASAEAVDGLNGVTVLLVDDHEVVRWGLRVLLIAQPWIDSCVGAGNQVEALARCESHAPDLAIVDLFVGHESGMNICSAIKGRLPKTKILMLSGMGEIPPMMARSAGASGFIEKGSSGRDLIAAAQQIAAGGESFSVSDSDVGASLTMRERQIIAEIASGATNREIAARLELSPHTIKDYAKSIYRKLGAHNRAEAVQKAQRAGLIVHPWPESADPQAL